jgi:hypothetical protein
MFVTQEDWQGREGRGRYLRSSFNRTLEPWPEDEFAELQELTKIHLQIANKTL